MAQASPVPQLRLDGREVELPPGAVILPGFVDAHCHLMGLGTMSERVALRGARSEQECVRRVAEQVRSCARGQWILGFGWNQEEWDPARMPDNASLDAVAPHNPVMLSRIDTHAVWVNSAALHAAGISSAHHVAGGIIHCGEDGKPSGVLLDNAIALIEAAMALPSDVEKMRWIRQGVEMCLRFGITEVHDMNVEPERMESMIRVAESGGMRLRCQVFLKAQNDEWRSVVRSPGKLADNLYAAGVKFFADGALGSRGALMLEPYSDMPSERGLALLSVDELVERASPALEAGFAVATHAIGDAANRIVLDAYSVLRHRYPAAVLRIEHAQILHPDDIRRFAELGVLPSMQPVHCTSDARMAQARIGPDRCRTAYPWRSLRETGLPLLGGSDFPIESADPLTGLRSYRFRIPEVATEPWHPEQIISREDAVASYTRWPHLGLPHPPNRGRIEAGCDADITVLSGDPFHRDTVALMTAVGS